MDSFELNPENITPRGRKPQEISPSSLRQSDDGDKPSNKISRIKITYSDPLDEPAKQTPTMPDPVEINNNPGHKQAATVEEVIDPQPPLGIADPATPKTESKQPDQTAQEAKKSPAQQHPNVVAMTNFLTDGRLRIFFGILLILLSGYMLVASISYISTYSADQSIVVNRTAAQIAAGSEGVANSAGWVGAMLSHVLMYKWLGLGGFIIIFYIGAIGISLVRLHKFQFWQLTFKSLVAAIALSIIAGLCCYGTVSPALWGGLHGYWVNNGLISAASLWGAIGVSILMAAALVLIFIGPISKAISHISMLIANRRKTLAERYRTSMAAAKAAMQEKEGAAAGKPAQKIADEDIAITPIADADNTRRDEKTENDDNQKPEGNADDAVTDHPSGGKATVTIHDRYANRPTATEVPSDNNTETASESVADTDRDDQSPMLEEITTAKTSTVTPADETSDTAGDNTDDTDDTDDAGEAKEPEAQTNTEKESLSIAVAQAGPIDRITTDDPADDMTDDMEFYDPTADLSNYRFPDIDLLHERQNTFVLSEEEQEENNQRIISTLDAYGIKIESIKATVGPTITLYEIVPQKGTRISSIKRLGDDMALSLSAIGIRIIAPIPGKGTIGMEVPNKRPQIVGIRSILSSRAYHESTAELPIAMGTTIDNQVYVSDLAKMPHLLVAGATGMGKSVGLNTIIASLLYKKHPAQLKFVLVDPKRVELSLYKCLERHFLAKLPDEEEPIITDPTKVVATLNSLCIEMENRYDLLSKAGMRGIKEYNQKFIQRRLNPEKGHRYMPYIVIIIDEFADLIMTAGKEIETPISRITAKARAVGIHIILATQRPSVNVITGLIKANCPGRIAFRVSQMNDSRTILDRPGAEQLIGRGDMLISRDGVLDRVQCAFIDTDEVEAICNYIATQQSYPSPYELPEELPATGGGGMPGSIADRDEMFADAGRAVIEAGMGSASLLQRKFNIGYPRAGKLIDQLEAAGVVGPQSGAGKPRAVLMDMYGFERMING